MSGAMQMLLATKATGGLSSMNWAGSAIGTGAGCDLTITLETNGTTSVSTSETLLTNTTSNWYSPTTTNIGFSYWVTVTSTGIDAITGTTSLSQISSSKAISLVALVGNKSGEATIEIFSDSGGVTKVSEIILTIDVEA